MHKIPSSKQTGAMKRAVQHNKAGAVTKFLSPGGKKNYQELVRASVINGASHELARPMLNNFAIKFGISTNHNPALEAVLRKALKMTRQYEVMSLESEIIRLTGRKLTAEETIYLKQNLKEFGTEIEKTHQLKNSIPKKVGEVKVTSNGTIIVKPEKKKGFFGRMFESISSIWRS